MWVFFFAILVLLGLSLWHGQLWVAALSVLSPLPLLASMRVRVVGPEVHGSCLGIRIHRIEIAAIRELMFLTGHGFRVRTKGGWTWLFGSASNVVDARRELVRRLDTTVLWHEAIGSLRPGESGFLPSAASLPAHIRGRPWWVLGVLASVFAWSQQAWMHGVSAIALIVVGALAHARGLTFFEDGALEVRTAFSRRRWSRGELRVGIELEGAVVRTSSGDFSIDASNAAPGAVLAWLCTHDRVTLGDDVRDVLATRDSERSGAQLVIAMEPGRRTSNERRDTQGAS
jgi:hypothetical protein